MGFQLKASSCSQIREHQKTKVNIDSNIRDKSDIECNIIIHSPRKWAKEIRIIVKWNENVHHEKLVGTVLMLEIM